MHCDQGAVLAKTAVKKKRVYQVAREFSISNEALIDFLDKHKHRIRNHMAPLTDEMYDLVCQNFQKVDEETSKESDFRKKLREKKAVEEARKEAIRHEIDEVLEMSKGDLSEAKPRIVRKKHAEIRRKKEKKELPAEAVQETVKSPVKEAPDAAVEKAPAAETVEKKEKKKEVRAAARAESEKEKPKRHLKRHPKSEERKGLREELLAELREVSTEDEKLRKGKKEEAPVETAHPKKKKRRKKKKKAAVQIDEKEIEASIKETLAKMGDTGKRRRRKKDRPVEEEADAAQDNILQTTEFVSVAELANLMHVEASEVIAACLSLGLMVSINQRLERDTILMVADEFGYDVRFLTEYGEERLEDTQEEVEDEAALEPRPPVVTIMGHVDHGKTSLLDYIRESNIIAGEAGGITQHIGAYEVIHNEKMITFLDTPGHEAFTAMRARGAQATDIVVLVVAADDAVMPQTVEAINHSRAAGVPMVVAINKIDKPGADSNRVKQQLSENNVLVEDWGGKVQSAEVSAKTGEGVDKLLDLIILEAEILELKANPCCQARGVLIETRLDKGRGIVGTVLVQKGTLSIGDIFVAGQYHGRVRAMFNERNHVVREAPPSTPVQVLGFTGMPQAGDQLVIVDTEQEAREIAVKRQQLKREQSFRQVRRLTLDQISKRIAEGEVRELSIVLKADMDGSVEALSDSLMDLGNEDVAVKIIHKGVGVIKESDVLLAEASQAVIIGFQVTPTTKAMDLAEREDVDIRVYKVIYDVVNDVKLALSGLLEPEVTEELLGTVEVRDIFKASKIGKIAGCYVQSGKILRNSLVRVLRDGEVVFEGKVSSLKRFKEDVKEVASGFECGLTLDNFNDIQVNDIVEAYRLVETARTLE